MIARFVNGSNKLDITTAPYSLGADFIPPAPAMEYNISSGTSANRYGGGALISEKASNRTFSFSVRILAGGTAAIQAAVRQLAAFVRDAEYFEWSYTGQTEPLWGQFGTPTRLQIITADCQAGSGFDDSVVIQKGVMVPVTLTVGPFALGRKQRLASALGGIWEDTTLTADRSSLGLRISEATTNKITNPIFTCSTWNLGWTAAASLTEIQNTNEGYCFEGSFSSAFLVAKAATNNTYTQSINAGNINKHAFSAIVARPDGAAVTSNDCVIWYNAAQTTVFTPLGYNGWYLATVDNITGINAGTTTGIQVKLGRAVYLIAFQMEEKVYHTPITHGDMLGSSWAGTVGNSTSARTAGRVRLPVAADTFNPGQWGVHLIWRPDYASTIAGDRFFFSCGAANIRGYFNATDDKIYLVDNTNSISVAQTFSAGDKLDLIFTGGPSGLAVFKNGVSIVSDGTYTPPATPTYVYIGTDDSAANHADGVFLLAETYGSEITQAKATAIYAAAGGAISNGFNVGRIPWHWIVDGDDVYDLHNDSGHKNWGVAGGIPGDYPAKLDLKATTTNENWININPMPIFHNPNDLFQDCSGSAHADYVGGEYKTVSVSTLATVETGKAITNGTYARDVYFGKSVYVVVRFADSVSSTVKIQEKLSMAGGVLDGPSKTLSTAGAVTALNLVIVGPLTVPNNPATQQMMKDSLLTSIYPEAVFTRASGTNNITLDYIAAMVGRVTYLPTVVTAYVVYGDTAFTGNGSYYPISLGGDALMLDGQKINTIQIYGRASITQAESLTSSFAVNWMYITPRWGLL